MTVEADPSSLTIYLDDLNPEYPAGVDQIKEGDNHIRLIKRVLDNTFPNITGAVAVPRRSLTYWTA